MVGHRVSQAELYDDKDVIIQILKLKDTVNDYAGGIIDSIDIVGDDLVIDWADGTSISLPLPSPTGISSVTGNVSGGDLTVTFYMTDGSSHAFTCPLAGMATEAYVDAGLATKADASSVYTKAETNTLLSGKVSVWNGSVAGTFIANATSPSGDPVQLPKAGKYLIVVNVNYVNTEAKQFYLGLSSSNASNAGWLETPDDPVPLSTNFHTYMKTISGLEDELVSVQAYCAGTATTVEYKLTAILFE